MFSKCFTQTHIDELFVLILNVVPPEYYNWNVVTKQLMHSYAADLSRVEQGNWEEVSTKDIGAGTEFALNLLLCK